MICRRILTASISTILQNLCVYKRYSEREREREGRESEREIEKMLTCIARSKQSGGDDSFDQPEKFDPNAAPQSKQAIKNLTSQVEFGVNRGLYVQNWRLLDCYMCVGLF